MIKYLPFFLCIFLTSFLSGQPTFQMRYGSPYHDRPKKVIQALDGNFLVVGHTDGFGSGGNALIMKVNTTGALLWAKDYSGINADFISGILELPDGNLVMCGSTYSYGAGASDAFVMKTDSVGNLTWARAYGDIMDEFFYEIVPDGANGFFVSGSATDMNTLLAGGTVTRIDSTGNILWARWMGDLSGPVSMYPLANGGVVFAQTINPNNNCSVWNFSSAGNIVWSKNLLPTPVYSGLHGISILENSSGEILVNTSLANTNTVAQSVDIFIIRLDNAGNLVSDKSYGGIYTDFACSISNTSDGGTLICGITNSAGNGDYDDCLIKLFANGSAQWSKAYGDVWAEYAYSASQTADGGYIMTGQTTPIGFDYDSSKVHLVKTDSLGNSSCKSITWYPVINNQTVTVSAASTPLNFSFIQDNTISWNLNNRYLYQRDICNPNMIDEPGIAEGEWTIYPNPFTTTATIGTETAVDNATLELFDVFGQLVKQIPLTNSRTEITRDELVNGIYIYQIVSGNKVVDRGKISVQ
jgi:hypothetical protein